MQLMVETGKTGGRRVLLIPSVPYLSTWLNLHPLTHVQLSFTFSLFLEELFVWVNPNKKYVFILDNAGFHKTDVVKTILNDKKKWITVEYIPSYSPELNPIETCWKVTKNAVTKSQHFITIDSMQLALESFWNKHIFMQNFITYLCR